LTLVSDTSPKANARSAGVHETPGMSDALEDVVDIALRVAAD